MYIINEMSIVFLLEFYYYHMYVTDLLPKYDLTHISFVALLLG